MASSAAPIAAAKSEEGVSPQLRVVNESGFPLQLAVCHLVETQRPRGWKVRYTEHAWRDSTSGESGFADVVLENSSGTQFMTVECKRVRDSDWVFVVGPTSTASRRVCKLWVTRYVGKRFKHFGWNDCPVDPGSFQSTFCAVRGQATNGSRPMIERVASELVTATEAIATQEKDFIPPNREDSFRVYISVIVTTAQLTVLRADPGAVALKDGMLDEAELVPVRYVRFRKQLSTAAAGPIPASFETPQSIAGERESTVFIVNAEHLGDFLTEFELDEIAANKFA